MSAMALAALAKGISKEFSFLLWIAAIALHTMILLAATFFCVVLPWTRPKQWLYTEQRSGSSNSLYGSTESTDRQDCESNSTIPCAATLLSRRLFTPGIFPITVGIGMGVCPQHRGNRRGGTLNNVGIATCMGCVGGTAFMCSLLASYITQQENSCSFCVEV
eukprot:m.678118 g.678118  ORF g.678118 m.678118 type:complete len:162 (-) comp22803_c0_seq30:766-1251(-)